MAKITRQLIDQQLEGIQRIVDAHPAGIGRIHIERRLAAAGSPIHRRTLTRRLTELVELRRVHTVSAGPGLRYAPGPTVTAPGPTPAVPTMPTAAVPAMPDADYNYIPLSPGAIEVRDLVRRTAAAKQPVGYDESFLARYQPGTMWYLPLTTREHLHQLGRTPDPERPAGTFARDIFNRLLIDLAWASSRLEGNTYSRLDTKNLLEFGLRATGKDVTEAQMVLNHKAAIEFLVDNAKDAGFDRRTFCNLHSLLAQNLVGDASEEGRVRRRMVNITGTVYVPPGIPQKIEEQFDRILATAAAIADPFEQAFFVMVHLPYLQPFIDVNKRTSRLGANISLIKANLVPLSFVDVPERAYVDGTLGVYELTRVDLLRDVFVWAYERSCTQFRVVRDSVGAPDPLRLRYRLELQRAVAETVRGGEEPRFEALRAWAVTHGVASADAEPFAETALSLLLDLYEGNLARVGLRPSEFGQWKSRFRPA